MQFTPTQKHTAAWLLIAALMLLALRALGPVLTPFVVAAVLAYALTPLLDRLDAVGKGRMPRVLTVILVGYYSPVRWPLPAGLVAVLLGMALAWGTGLIAIDPLAWRADVAQIGLHLPRLQLAALWQGRDQASFSRRQPAGTARATRATLRRSPRMKGITPWAQALATPRPVAPLESCAKPASHAKPSAIMTTSPARSATRSFGIERLQPRSAAKPTMRACTTKPARKPPVGPRR